MKIVRLESENVKRISAVEITPTGNLVVIGGANGAGKTSVLDSIAYALGGKSLIPSEPIRRGEDAAKVSIDLGDLTVTRTFTDSGSYLQVRTKDGAKYDKPQQILDELVGRLSFDPLAFVRMKPADQSAALRELVGVDHSELDGKRAALFEDRTEVNREAKRIASVIGTREIDHDLPTDIESLDDALEAIDKATAHNQKIDSASDATKTAEQKIEVADDRIAELESQLKELRESRDRLAKYAEETKAAVEAAERIDVEAMRERIRRADETNEAIRANGELQTLIEQREAVEAKVAKLTESIKSIDEQKAADLAAAEFPVDGLTFDETGVRFGDAPFDQASAAEQLRVSVAMGIASNPKLRVLLIRDASLLDDDGLAMVADMAEKHDAQLWIERVGDEDEMAIVIEDGHVRGSDDEPGDD